MSPLAPWLRSLLVDRAALARHSLSSLLGASEEAGRPPERHAPGLADIPLSRLGHCTSLAAPSPPRGPAWPVLLSSKAGDSSSSAPEPQALGEQRPCRGYPEHLGGCPSTAG